MENGYCSKDDYSFLAEQLKYKFVKKGHYAVRQGDKNSDVFFIIKGSANVMTHDSPALHVYLDSKAMYNEIAVQRARTRQSVRLCVEAIETTNKTLNDMLSYVQI